MSANNRLSDAQQAQLDKLIGTLQPGQLAWVEGYISGISKAKPTGIPGSFDVASLRMVSQNPSLTILFGTHTGRSETLARQLSKKAVQSGISTIVTNMQDYNTKSIQKEKNLVVIVSTHGEGDPPVQAEDFWEFIRSKRAPKLDGIHTAVLALGDKSYEKYCQTGIDIDEAFRKLGSNPLLPVTTCDVDFEPDAAVWIDKVVEALAKIAPITEQALPVANENEEETSSYSKTNPYYATVLEKINLSGAGSDKEVYHIELSLESSGLRYEPGDSIGIYSDNPPELVQEIIAKTGFSASDEVNVKAGKLTFEQALCNHLEITVLTRDLLKKYAALTSSEALLQLLTERDKLNDFLFGHDLLDLIVTFSGTYSAQQLVDVLRPLPPRMYSISSSEKYVPEEVHITVAIVRYEKNNRLRLGAASTFLSDRIEIDGQVPVFIDHNPNFKLPENRNTPVIMIGPGTGVAPFRAFMQQREADGIQGKSWLFFGDQHFFTDFSYQTEWQKWLKNGELEKLSLAFSRDQADKIYVQHRMFEQKKELFQWIEKGANIYVCGDMKRMAKDVEQTLTLIISEEGNLSVEQARDYLKNLYKQKRYQLDVY